MAKEIPAWRAEDGSLHTDEGEALEADAKLALRNLDVFQHNTIGGIVAEAEEVVRALEPLVAFRSKKATREA